MEELQQLRNEIEMRSAAQLRRESNGRTFGTMATMVAFCTLAGVVGWKLSMSARHERAHEDPLFQPF